MLDIHRDHSRKAILYGVVVISAELGIKVVAEIIEDAWARGFYQMQRLSDAGLFVRRACNSSNGSARSQSFT